MRDPVSIESLRKTLNSEGALLKSIGECNKKLFDITNAMKIIDDWENTDKNDNYHMVQNFTLNIPGGGTSTNIGDLLRMHRQPTIEFVRSILRAEWARVYAIMDGHKKKLAGSE
jgi:hypothetical protein